MSILRKFGAATVAAAVMGSGLMAASTQAHAAPTGGAVPAAKTAPAATTSSSAIVRGKLQIDRRCLAAGRILCVNKTTRKVVFMLNGKVLKSADARFGGPATPTRQGVFKVYRKSRHHVSRQYGSAMPYAMFFSGGQAIHYSADFRARGYAGASHGCVNMRNREAIAWMYARTKINDKVIVYRS
ncbi:L,D-transpeptidase [Kribbella sp. NBC_01245]|uniref:L,D-transpeptidase n=1 Tax=Kribbella sp. NBC_01245 TaxID=2903578 RepID=UPI002E299943|nr:L,D-transpeptidase [Kribbella sp. NBC_01245]